MIIDFIHNEFEEVNWKISKYPIEKFEIEKYYVYINNKSNYNEPIKCTINRTTISRKDWAEVEYIDNKSRKIVKNNIVEFLNLCDDKIIKIRY